MKKTVTPELIEAAFNDSNWKGAFYENDTQLRPLENVFVLLKGAVIDRILQFILPAPDPTQRITDMDIRSLTSLFESRGYTVKVISEHVQYGVTLKKALKYKITWYPYLLVYADANFPGLETSASLEEIADCLDAIDAASPKVSSLIGRKYNEEAQLIRMDNIFGAAVQAFLPEGFACQVVRYYNGKRVLRLNENVGGGFSNCLDYPFNLEDNPDPGRVAKEAIDQFERGKTAEAERLKG